MRAERSKYKTELCNREAGCAGQVTAASHDTVALTERSKIRGEFTVSN